MADEVDNQIVEEFPPPPAYFKLFEKGTLEAPPVPLEDPYKQAYNGCFAHIREIAGVYDPNRDYKTSLKGLLKESMQCALKLLSYSDPALVNVDQNVVQLREKLNEVHCVLSDYRAHEAREQLCADMQGQVEGTQKLERELAEVLASSRLLAGVEGAEVGSTGDSGGV
ncbi:hypothetical protein B484DRAFT_454632 [Ochromonadaceae sp. CCMP2298]|nr:hypothetical protein B484DRAFT_454632 [Ochromonadaceae sp. CCMP2298]